jgi:hypothetical protein
VTAWVSPGEMSRATVTPRFEEEGATRSARATISSLIPRSSKLSRLRAAAPAQPKATATTQRVPETQRTQRRPGCTRTRSERSGHAESVGRASTPPILSYYPMGRGTFWEEAMPTLQGFGTFASPARLARRSRAGRSTRGVRQRPALAVNGWGLFPLTFVLSTVLCRA